MFIACSGAISPARDTRLACNFRGKAAELNDARVANRKLLRIAIVHRLEDALILMDKLKTKGAGIDPPQSFQRQPVDECFGMSDGKEKNSRVILLSRNGPLPIR